MSDLDYLHPVHRCRALVGGFLQSWALMENELRKTLQKALGLDDTQGLIVAANIQLRDKINILRTVAHRTVSASDEEKRQIDLKLQATASYATANRNMMAHNMFMPSKDGKGVDFLVVKAKGKLRMPEVVWSEADFDTARETINDFKEFLIDLRNKIEFAGYLKLIQGPSQPTAGLLGLGLLGTQFPLPPGILGSGADLASPKTDSENPPTEPE